MSLAGDLKAQLPEYARHLHAVFSLKRFNTWRVGGVAECLFEAPSIEAIQALFQVLPKETPVTWLGLGSNVLVADNGIPGIVIVTQGGLSTLSNTDSLFFAEAGVPCAKLARLSARSGFENGEFFAGIPGTVGGALAMNAGAFGSETWLHVESVTCLNREGILSTRTKDEFKIAYRKAVGRENEWFVSANFRFQPGEATVAQQRIRALLAQRKATQPTGEHTCGSVFKNPTGDHAGRLIEACGLKGHTIGGAVVSPKHANFIVNLGEATAKDITSLIEHIQSTVYAAQGVKLEPEVKFL